MPKSKAHGLTTEEQKRVAEVEELGASAAKAKAIVKEAEKAGVLNPDGSIAGKRATDTDPMNADDPDPVCKQHGCHHPKSPKGTGKYAKEIANERAEIADGSFDERNLDTGK